MQRTVVSKVHAVRKKCIKRRKWNRIGYTLRRLIEDIAAHVREVVYGIYLEALNARALQTV